MSESVNTTLAAKSPKGVGCFIHTHQRQALEGLKWCTSKPIPPKKVNQIQVYRVMSPYVNRQESSYLNSSKLFLAVTFTDIDR